MPGVHMRVPAEDIKQVATVINGTEYRARGGFFDMPDDHAAIHLDSANMPGWQAARGAYGRRAGYRCTNPECNFGSFFTTCSRCQSPCTREDPHATQSAHHASRPATR